MRTGRSDGSTQKSTTIRTASSHSFGVRLSLNVMIACDQLPVLATSIVIGMDVLQ